MQLQTPDEFFLDFIKIAGTAKDRIWLQAMLFEAGEKANQLETVLLGKQSDKNSIDIRVVIDWVSNVAFKGAISVMPKLRKTAAEILTHEETSQILANFRKSGIKVFVNNLPNFIYSLLPLVKRNHIKIYIVDNNAWLGGVNFTDNSFTNFDFMVKFSDLNIVNKIAEQFNINSYKTDFKTILNDDYVLLVDKGDYGKSIILNTALTMIQNSQKEIFFASQCVPDGIILKNLIKKAKQGVKIIVLTSNIEDEMFHKQPYKLLYQYFKFATKNYQNIQLIHYIKRVHAKYLATDKKAVLFGSHNLLQSSSLIGTKEIGMYSTDKNIVEKLSNMFNAVLSR